MKTPDEIKKGLECCFGLLKDPQKACKGCPYGDMRRCNNDMGMDALAYIKLLEAENVRFKQERDTALEILRQADLGGDSMKTPDEIKKGLATCAQ